MNYDVLFTALLFVGAGIAITVLSRYFSKAALTRRALAAARTTSIAAAREGEVVKVTGTLRLLGAPLEAPLSGRRCAAWEVSVQERHSGGRWSRWREVVREQESTVFLLEDETGRAIVDVARPRMALVDDGRYRSGTFQDAKAEFEAFLAARGLSSTGLLGFNKTMRYREGVLEEGETVAVLGRCRWEPDPDPRAVSVALREAPMRLVLEDPPDGQLLVSDDSRAR